MSTVKEVAKILTEIEAQPSPGREYGSQKTTEEIVSILLNQELEKERAAKMSAYEIEYNNLLNDLRSHANLFFRPIISTRKLIGPIIVFAKRFVRRAFSFLLLPIYEEQTQNNHRLIGALELNKKQLEIIKIQLNNAIADKQED